MIEAPILMLLPYDDPPREGRRPRADRYEMLAEIVEALQEGAYAVHESASDGKRVTLAHDGRSCDLSARLGGSAESPMSILVPTHEDRSTGDAVAEALAVLTSPHRMEGAPRQRIDLAMCAIVCANQGGRLDENRIARTACPWGPFGITHIDVNGRAGELDIDADLASMLPMIVEVDWNVLDSGETVLELAPLSVTVWTHLEMDAVEALRTLSGLETSPLITG